MKSERINHDGRVVEVSDNKVVAEILVSEACGSCQAKGLCHNNGKKMQIEAQLSDNQKIEVGDEVVVSFTPQLAMSSVFLAYVLPLILMFVVMFGLINITGSQDIGCLSGLSTLPLYYIVLYMLRTRLRKKFKFEVEKR